MASFANASRASLFSEAPHCHVGWRGADKEDGGVREERLVRARIDVDAAGRGTAEPHAEND